MTPADRRLGWLLRATAAVLLLAVAPVFFPPDAMADLHARLGLGTFPTDRVTEYLARSASACYALHGGVLLLLSLDVRRNRPLIAGVYVLHFGFALTVLGIDLAVGMPGWWTLAEAGTIGTAAVLGLTLVRAARRAESARPAHEGPNAAL